MKIWNVRSCKKIKSLNYFGWLAFTEKKTKNKQTKNQKTKKHEK